MARIRTIKPEFWGHPKVARVSRDARLLFLGLLNESDDEGLLLGSTKRIAGVVFPHDDDVTAKRVDRWLTELEGVCLIYRYVVEDTAYIILPGFEEHQKVSHPSPSRLPKPSGIPQELFVPYLGSRILGSRKGDSAGNGAPDPRIQTLVSGYVDDFRTERENHDPSRSWRASAGSAIKKALNDGESEADIAVCLGVIAHESKNPSTLPYVLADFHAGKERRQ